MIELKKDALLFSFPEVHPDAVLRIDFQRTLRIPDDEDDYPLPPGLGRFPLRHVDDFAARLPPAWLRRGGVLLPMYQAEALWLNFTCPRGGPVRTGDVRGGTRRSRGRGRLEHGYPFAVKIAAGKVNAVTGEPWDDGLHLGPQDYLALPTQPWLDGYAVEKGVIRQFVAMPLGAGYTAEEQLRGVAEHGGIQIVACPMKREAYERRRVYRLRERVDRDADISYMALSAPASLEMGLAPGGRMRQEIYDDPFDFSEWDTRHASRCFVHLTHAHLWRAITGEDPPTVPPTAEEYTRAGLPWFDYYADEREALGGAEILKKLKSVAARGAEKGEVPLPENEPVTAERIVKLRKGLRPGQVREGRF